MTLWLFIFYFLWTYASHYTHTFNGPSSGTTQVSWYQKGKTNLDFTEARDSEWQWHQLGYMQVCTSLRTDNRASTSPLSCFTGQMPFLPPNQQHQSTEGTLCSMIQYILWHICMHVILVILWDSYMIEHTWFLVLPWYYLLCFRQLLFYPMQCDTVQFMIYDTRCYYVRSKANMSQLNLPHGNDN